MRALFAAIAVCACATIGVAAQQSGEATKTETKTKVKIEDGRDIKVTGCVARAEDGSLMLTDVAGKQGEYPDYLLIADGSKQKDLAQHIGHELEVEGTAANTRNGKVKVEVQEKIKPEGGKEQKRETKSEMQGNVKLPLFGVKSYKMLASVCRGSQQ